MALTQITSGGIKDGEVKNSDLDASAAVAGTKIAPDFGSQNIVTTGSVSGAAGTLTGDLTIPDKIVHTGDTDTIIRFPAADTISFETGGTERLRVASGRLVVGHTASDEAGGSVSGKIQSWGDRPIQGGRASADAAGPTFTLFKTRNASPGSHTIVQDDDTIGTLQFAADDGTDYRTTVARIRAAVDGTPGENDMPGRLIFGTTPDGGQGAEDRMIIDSRGQVGLGDGAAALPPTGNNNRVRIIHGFDHGVDGTTFQTNAHLVLQNNNSGISGTGPGGGNYSLGTLSLAGTHTNGTVRSTKICGAEKLSIYVNDQEDALDSPTILMDRDWIHIQGTNANREIYLQSYTSDGSKAILWIADDGHRLDGGQANGRGTFSVDGTGRIWAKQNLYLGRGRNIDGNTNFYENVGTGIQMYHGDTNDSTKYCQRFSITPYSGSDMGDFNIISWWTNGAGTGQVDTSDTAGNTDLKLSIKADGRVQGASHFFCGRVEGSDGSPTSSYTDASLGIFTYGNNAEARAYMHGYAAPTNSNYSFFVETGTSTSNDDVQFKVRGSDGTAYNDGSWSTTEADYAEYFEWKDGNPSNEDRVGKTVVLEDGKIRFATDSDDKSKIIGVISGAPAVVGDSGELKWHGRWLKDDFGRDVTDDVELLVWNHGKHEFQPEQSDTFHLKQCESSIRVSEIEEGLKNGTVPQWAVDQNLRLVSQERKKNPDYDPKKVYIPREERKEWDAVGLVGKLYVYKDQPKGTNWIKLSDKTSTIERWLVR